MRCWTMRLLAMAVGVLALPYRAPAPLIYTPGEGWRYEKVGEEKKWMRTRAKEQLDVAQEAFDHQDYALALKAAKRTVTQWPFSDYAPQAQYLQARCLEAKGDDQGAFKQYQNLLQKYAKASNYAEVLDRQFAIANKYLNGKSYRLWGYIPIGASMVKTVEMYDKIIKNGPYSDCAPQAQLNIGAAEEKKKVLWIKAPEYPAAAKAYERAADRYADRDRVAAEALFKAGLAYEKQAMKAEYDQSIAGQAINTFSDFTVLHPEDPRVVEAQKLVAAMKTEQARGSFMTAKYYEKRHRWRGAAIYYNDVLRKDPESKFAAEARTRLVDINRRIEADPTVPVAAPKTPAASKTPASEGGQK